jgi:hypothetical protein
MTRTAAFVWLIVILCAPAFANAGVREDQRECQFGYWKTLKRGGSPPQTQDRDQQYCTALAYWFQPSPLPHDPKRAAEWHAAAARQGHVAAMIALGYQYERGEGVAPDPPRAVELYRRAAEAGSSDGMFLLARTYTSGKGVARADPAQARAWLERAAAAGNLEAKASLAQQSFGANRQPGQETAAAAYAAVGRKDYAQSAALYRRAAEQGNTNAMVALGTHYRQGLGVSVDPNEAARWYRTAAERGDPGGEAQIGFSYENGEGVPENWAEMRRWCEKSAAQVHPLGLNCVGRLYQFGMAVPMDRAKARTWFERAADRDDPYSRWFAIHLRTPRNCIGYRSAPERERFFGVCVEPTGLTFQNSRERNRWLQARYNELEAEALKNWGAGGSYESAACQGSGGSWAGGNCRVPGGALIDPYSGR